MQKGITVVDFTQADAETKNTIFTGDPVEDMEIAKRLIGKYPNVDLRSLILIAANRTEAPWVRIAAIYTLGFTDDKGLSKTVLTRIIADDAEPANVKDHAVEALDSITPHHP